MLFLYCAGSCAVFLESAFNRFFFLERLGKGLAGGLENALAPLACSLSCSLSVSRSPKRSLVFLCLVGVS